MRSLISKGATVAIIVGTPRAPVRTSTFGAMALDQDLRIAIDGKWRHVRVAARQQLADLNLAFNHELSMEDARERNPGPSSSLHCDPGSPLRCGRDDEELPRMTAAVNTSPRAAA